MIQDWKTDRPDRGEELWNCGFCRTVSNSWKTRLEHILEHFTSGEIIPSWQGLLIIEEESAVKARANIRSRSIVPDDPLVIPNP